MNSSRAYRRPDDWPLAIAALFLALAGVYTYLGMWRYDVFRAGVDDAVFTQIVNSAFTGFSATAEGLINHYLVHFSPILYVAFPFVKLLDGARGLILLQSLLAAATIFPVWGLAVSRLPKPMAFATTLAAAIYPPLSGQAVGDFHELAFAPPLAATLVWAIDRRLWRVAIVTAVALALVKEDQFVSLAFVGLVTAAMARREPKMRSCGFWIAAIAVIAALLYFVVLRPAINPHVPYWSLHYYQWWWFPATPAGFVGPFSPLRAQYLFAILLPLAFLPLASRYMLFAIPGLAEVLLSHEGITMVLGTHYSAAWSGYVLCAFVDGTFVLYTRSKLAATGALLAALAASVWTSVYFSPINPAFALYERPNAADRLREKELARIPRNVWVGTSVWILPHIAMNPHATIALDDMDYVVLYRFTESAPWPAGDRAKIAQLMKSGYVRTFDGAGIIVLARSHAQ
ncbi:MAG TPA: DUF2079 domain-containing protein [Candidatus Babeliales bacterium]|nr:DUF2079 domain-containing protein [Candidatus Babeliales bacterium]